MKESKLEKMVPTLCLGIILGLATSIFYAESKMRYGSLKKTYERFIEETVDKYPSKMFNP